MLFRSNVKFNLLNYRSFGGDIAIKFDIHKTFDTLDWKFLLTVLEAFGFNVVFRKWIDVILHSASLSFSLNGRMASYFTYKRGEGSLARQSSFASSFLLN